MDQLSPSAVKERIETDEQRVGPLTRERSKGRVNLVDGAGVEQLYLQSHGASYRFNFALVILRIGRIDQHGHTRRCGHQLTQECEPFSRQLPG